MDIIILGIISLITACIVIYVYTYFYYSVNDREITEIQTYDEFFQTAKSGDLLLFNSMSFGTMYSKLLTGLKWSHCGMLYIDPKTKVLYEWSSHREKENFISKTGKPVDGPQLIELERMVREYGGFTYIPIGDVDMSKIIEEVYRKLSPLPFNYNIFEILSVFGIQIPRGCGTGYGITCAQLTALTYIHNGDISNDINIWEYTPDTFYDNISNNKLWISKRGNPIKVIGFKSKNIEL